MKSQFLKEVNNELTMLANAWKDYLANGFLYRLRKRHRYLLSFLVMSFLCLGATTFIVRNIVYAQSEMTGSGFTPFSTGNIFSLIMGGGALSLALRALKRYYPWFKRVFDFSVALVSLIVLSPLFLLIAIIIKFDSDGPVFFTQTRLGKNGKLFDIIKFRTMRVNAERETGPVWAQDDDPRITRFGKFLRKSHLDELPQFINVIRGDMSLVGPRPERPEFSKMIEEHVPYFSQRVLIKPGITGLAQVRYPYGASVKDAHRKLKYDMLYMEKVGPTLDFQIAMWTASRVLTGEGAR